MKYEKSIVDQDLVAADRSLSRPAVEIDNKIDGWKDTTQNNSLEKRIRIKDFSFDIALDIFRHFWMQFFVIGGLSIMVIGTQAVVVTIMFSYFSEGSDLPGIVSIVTSLANNLGPFAFATLIFVIGTVSALGMFLSRVIAVSIMTGYEKLCVHRIIDIFKHDKSLFGDMTKADFIILLTKDCRFGGRIAFELTGAILPIGISLVAFPALLYLNLYATLGLLAIILMVGFSQQLLRHKIHEVSHDMEVDVTKDKEAKIALFQKLRSGDDIEAGAENNVPHPIFMDAYRRRLTVPHVGNLIGGLHFILALVIIIAAFGYSDEKYSSAYLLLYIFVSIFTLSHIRSLSKIYMNIQVFYNYFQRAYLVIIGESELARKKIFRQVASADDLSEELQ